ncbi:extracellular solute-binding protein [Alkalithermobacter paradoxus]|uniref:Multiple sugar-binding protein n=1 Tax=Alkalithermobacter paradoxus TaxID=29349 RepID=A0A1V4I7K4_9FIRM|nr:multiple sugar-binding protein precursor [[Clostridium] thermoalcaliphilum]
MNKKFHSVVLILALALMLMATGCSSVENSGSQENQKGDDRVTIKFMHLWPAGSSRQHNMLVSEIIEEYQNLNPHVRVVQEVLENEQYKNKLQISSASNDLPDIGMTWAGGFIEPYVKGNRFTSLNDILDGDLKAAFIPGTTEAYEVDGQTYALPLELNIVPLYYNKSIFAKYNLEVPRDYEEFKSVVKTLTDNNVAPIALGNRDRWTGSLWYMYLADRIGGPDVLTNAINRTGSFEDESLVKAAEEIQNLVNMNAFVRGFNGLSNDEGKAEFLNGNAAMYLMGSWELPNFTTDEEVSKEFRDSVGYFKFPVVEGGKGNVDSWVGGPGVGLFVAENSPVRDEAKKFVKFFVERWGQQAVTRVGVIPATTVDTSELDLPELYIDVLNDLREASNITLFADVQMKAATAETHLNMIQSLFGNQASPRDFAREHEEALAGEAK